MYLSYFLFSCRLLSYPTWRACWHVVTSVLSIWNTIKIFPTCFTRETFQKLTDWYAFCVTQRSQMQINWRLPYQSCFCLPLVKHFVLFIICFIILFHFFLTLLFILFHFQDILVNVCNAFFLSFHVMLCYFTFSRQSHGDRHFHFTSHALNVLTQHLANHSSCTV